MNDNKILTCLGAGAAIVVMVAAASVIYGYVASIFWVWFIMPVFDVRAITIYEAIGLALFAGLFTSRSSNKTDDETTFAKFATLVVAVLVVPWFTLGIGYIVHLLIIR